MLAIRADIAAELLNRGHMPQITERLLRKAENSLREENESLAHTNPEAALFFDLEVQNLRALRTFFSQGCSPVAPDEVYRSFAENYSPAAYPTGDLPPEVDPTGNLFIGLKLLFRTDKEWSEFAFSLFPTANISALPFDGAKTSMGEADITKGIMRIASFRKGPIGAEGTEAGTKWTLPSSGTEPGTRLSFLEACGVIAHEAEHLLFGRFLRGFFTYPVFTELCFPFVADIREHISDLAASKPIIDQVREETEDKESVCLDAARFFNELRALLRHASVMAKIGFHYDKMMRAGKRDGGYLFMWEESLERAKKKIEISEELLSFANKALFDLTELGKTYVSAEVVFLENVKSTLKESEGLLSFWVKH
jgi:hypothetical protein